MIKKLPSVIGGAALAKLGVQVPTKRPGSIASTNPAPATSSSAADRKRDIGSALASVLGDSDELLDPIVRKIEDAIDNLVKAALPRNGVVTVPVMYLKKERTSDNPFNPALCTATSDSETKSLGGVALQLLTAMVQHGIPGIPSEVTDLVGSALAVVSAVVTDGGTIGTVSVALQTAHDAVAQISFESAATKTKILESLVFAKGIAAAFVESEQSKDKGVNPVAILATVTKALADTVSGFTSVSAEVKSFAKVSSDIVAAAAELIALDNKAKALQIITAATASAKKVAQDVSAPPVVVKTLTMTHAIAAAVKEGKTSVEIVAIGASQVKEVAKAIPNTPPIVTAMLNAASELAVAVIAAVATSNKPATTAGECAQMSGTWTDGKCSGEDANLKKATANAKTIAKLVSAAAKSVATVAKANNSPQVVSSTIELVQNIATAVEKGGPNVLAEVAIAVSTTAMKISNEAEGVPAFVGEAFALVTAVVEAIAAGGTPLVMGKAVTSAMLTKGGVIIKKVDAIAGISVPPIVLDGFDLTSKIAAAALVTPVTDATAKNVAVVGLEQISVILAKQTGIPPVVTDGFDLIKKIVVATLKGANVATMVDLSIDEVGTFIRKLGTNSALGPKAKAGLKEVERGYALLENVIKQPLTGLLSGSGMTAKQITEMIAKMLPPIQKFIKEIDGVPPLVVAGFEALMAVVTPVLAATLSNTKPTAVEMAAIIQGAVTGIEQILKPLSDAGKLPAEVMTGFGLVQAVLSEGLLLAKGTTTKIEFVHKGIIAAETIVNQVVAALSDGPTKVKIGSVATHGFPMIKSIVAPIKADWPN